MSSRERMRDGEVRKQIENILAEELSRHEGLKQLNQERRERQITKNPKDTKFLEGVVSKLVKKNRTILNYLGFGGNIKDRGETGKIEDTEFEGKYIPTYLKVKGSITKQIPINSFARIILETDASNNYFKRESDQGTLIVYPDIMKSSHLWNGKITIKLVPPKNARIGEKKKVIALLTRPNGEPLSSEFEIEYIAGDETKTKPVKPPKPPKVKDYNLPKSILVYKEKREGDKSWDEVTKEDGVNWDGEDIAKVIPSGNGAGVDVFINMDADILHNFLKQQQTSGRKQEFIKRSWETAIFLHSLVIYNDLAKSEKGDMVPDIMKSVSKIILDLMCNETFLKELEKGE